MDFFLFRMESIFGSDIVPLTSYLSCLKISCLKTQGAQAVHSITRLLELSKNGSGTAFGHLFRRIWPKALAIAQRKTIQSGFGRDSEDVAQMAMLRFWKKISTLDSSEADRLKNRDDLDRLMAFLLKENHSRVIRDGLRQKRDARRTISLIVPEHSPSDSEESNEFAFQEHLDGALAGMAPNRKTAVALHFFEQHSIKEVAEILGCSGRSVQRYLEEFRARFLERWGK